MERIRFVDREGQKILLVDCTGCSAEEVAAIADKVPAHLSTEPPGSVLLLADFTGSKLNRDTMERVKIAAAIDRKHIKRSAWVFNGNIPKPLHDSVQTFSSREIPKFETRDEAMAYLVNKR